MPESWCRTAHQQVETSGPAKTCTLQSARRGRQVHPHPSGCSRKPATRSVLIRGEELWCPHGVRRASISRRTRFLQGMRPPDGTWPYRGRHTDRKAGHYRLARWIGAVRREAGPCPENHIEHASPVSGASLPSLRSSRRSVQPAGPLRAIAVVAWVQVLGIGPGEE